jgi:hypothetical protein
LKHSAWTSIKQLSTFNYKEPSQTLFQLLGFVSSAAEKFADQTDQVVNDSSGYGPVGTTMALIEASAKFFSAVHKRLHHAQRQQFKILAQINETFVPVNGYPYATPEGDMTIFQQDFDGRVDVLPVSDPNIPSRAHRLSLASLALQLAAQTPPGTFNNTELIRQVLEAADFPNIDQVIPAKQEAQPADPVTDIMNATKGMPITAFPGQDHESHIQVKTNFLQDPTAGASEAFKQFAPILQANIREHMMLRYKTQIEGVVAQTVPPEQYQMAVQQGMQDAIIAEAAYARMVRDMAGTSGAANMRPDGAEPRSALVNSQLQAVIDRERGANRGRVGSQMTSEDEKAAVNFGLLAAPGAAGVVRGAQAAQRLGGLRALLNRIGIGNLAKARQATKGRFMRDPVTGRMIGAKDIGPQPPTQLQRIDASG